MKLILINDIKITNVKFDNLITNFLIKSSYTLPKKMLYDSNTICTIIQLYKVFVEQLIMIFRKGDFLVFNGISRLYQMI